MNYRWGEFSLESKKIKDETVKISARLPKNKLELLAAEYRTNSITELLSRLIDDKLEHKFKASHERSVITSIGAKNRLAKRIIDFIPTHSTYIELFGNTASILLKKPRIEREIYNDIDGNVTNFFLVLRDNPAALYNACSSLPYSQDVYYNFLESPIPDEPLEKAVRFFYLNRGSFLGNHIPGFRSDSKGRNYSKFYYSECERFFAISKRFHGVEITNKDYKIILKRNMNTPDTFFLCDPPYFDGTDYYNNSFKLKDHSQLAHLLSQIKGKAMVCHSKDYQIHKLYIGLGFRAERIRTKYYSSIKNTENGIKERPATELYLYMNY